MRSLRRTAIAVFAASACVAMLAPAAGAAADAPAAQQQRPFLEYREAYLKPIPHDPSADGGSSTTGKVAFLRFFNQLIVLQYVNGSAAGLPHAQHVHGIGLNQCPDASRAGDDGLISTLEAAPDYGGIQASLTTRGDTSADSALAVPRFPAANTSGTFVYGRVLAIGRDIPEEVGYNLTNYHVVVHGIDLNNSGGYDFDAGASELDPSLPFEATIPAACGTIG